MRSKVFISVLVALALAFSFGITVKDAKADQLMFPWILKSTAVSTLVSVVNTAGMTGTYEFMSVPFRLHYDYYYKATTANLQTETCINHSFKQYTSKDDIITFDGEAMFLELANGAAWGYIAYNASPGPNPSQTSPVTCFDGQDDLGEVVGGAQSVIAGIPIPNPHAGGERTQTVWLPDNMGTTRVFLTPMDTVVVVPSQLGCPPEIAANQRQGNINTRVQLIVQQPDGTFVGGIYNNDEEILDFNNPKNIVCTSADNIDQLVAGGALNYLTTTGRQGWSFIGMLDGTFDGPDADTCADNPALDMSIGKLEFTTTGVDFDNNGSIEMSGTFNNFVWLRDRTTAVPGPGFGTNVIHKCRWTPPAGPLVCVKP